MNRRPFRYVVALISVVAVMTFSPDVRAQIRAGLVNLTSMVTGVLPVANGGTGIASGTSGGVLGYTASGTLASSGALTANQIVLGGGAGATPTVLSSLGTTTTLLHGNAAGAPTFGAVSLTADVSGTLPVNNGGTGITSFGTGVATWLGTPSATNLNSALTGGKSPIVLCSTGTASSTGNSTSEANQGVCTIPAGTVGTNGTLQIFAMWKFVGTNGTKTPTIRHNTTSGATSGGTVVCGSVNGVSTTLSENMFICNVTDSNAANAQVFSPANTNNGQSISVSTSTLSTGAIDTASTSYLNFNYTLGSASDTSQLSRFVVTLYPGVCSGTAPSC